MNLPRSVLVTGGAGYIGSHIAKAFARHGLQPVVLDNLATGNRWAVKWGPLVEGDICEEALVRHTVHHYKIEAVIHLAASAYVGESVQNPRKYFRNNASKSLQFLDALIDAGVQKLVFSSTCATYGRPEYLPIDENHPQTPVNPYGETKLFIEKALKWYSPVHQLRSVCLRYFNAAGADQEGDIGESHDPESHLIPITIQTALGSRLRTTLYGTDFPTPDGTAIRDYVHVADLADAHVRALEYLESGGPTTALNLGTGSGHSVGEVIRSVERTARRRISVACTDRRAGDPAALVACADVAKRVLGWEPKFTSLDEIIETAWQWHAQRGPAATAAI